MPNRRILLTAIPLTSSLWIAMASPPVAADTAPASGDTASLTEVVVTATKRAERLQDVAGSITALTAEQLTGNGAVRFEDYLGHVPGLVADNTASGGGLNQLSIRGLNTGESGNPTVGFYIDDAPFGSSTNLGGGAIMSPDLDPSDLTRIEVMRGPQGTLYGAGSLGGLVKFVTTPPEFGRYSGRVELSGSTVEHGGTGYSLRGAVNLPLSDNLALRVSGLDREDPGFIRDGARGATQVNKDTVHGGRVALAWRPHDAWTVRLTAFQQRLDADGSAVMDFNPATGQPMTGDLQQVRAPGTEAFKAKDELYDLNISGALGWADFVSATSYGKQTYDGNPDFTSVYGALLDGIFSMSNIGVSVPSGVSVAKYSQEFRLSSPDTQTLAWQAGVFYTHEKADVAQSLVTFNAMSGAALDTPLPSLLAADVASTFEEYAGFGDLTYHFNTRFDVTAGLRYSHNTQKAAETSGGALVGPTSTVNLASSDHSVTYLLTPRFHLDKDTMVYLRIASGYGPGGPNIVVTQVPPSYKPDTVVNYEVGIKSDFFDRRLTVDAAAYYIDWQDIQLRETTAAGTNYYDNGGKASSKGLEAAADWRVSSAFSLFGNVTYVDATLGTALPSPLIGTKGDRLPSTPRLSGMLGGDYKFELTGALSASVGASWRYVGERLADFQKNPAVPRYVLPSYNVVDLHARIQRGSWAATAYVKNLSDSRGKISNSPFFTSVVENVIIQPRTLGLSIAYTF
jgi:iron complex outermembrane recepter protein